MVLSEDASECQAVHQLQADSNALVSCFCPFHVSLSSCSCLVLQGQGMLPYFANFRLLAEFSTPCVNQR